VQFRILGPLEITVDSERIDLGGTRQQIVIATLLLGANLVVTTDRLLEAVYGEDPPPTSRSQAQISISSLRRTFARHGSAAIIKTHPLGYIIELDGDRLDSQRFAELVAAGHAARNAALPEQAAGTYRDALRLWRGPALDGIDSQLIRAAASRLDEERIAINEDCIDLELELGRHHELVGELAELVEQHPLRERLRGQLMLTLYRCDRTAEALQVYRETRRTMISELGIEPSARLRQLERAILTSDPALAVSAESVRSHPEKTRVHPGPNLLPADIGDFVGRAEEIDQIRKHLADPVRERKAGTAVPVVVIAGKGGVGKTSLAVHVSHVLAPYFPDGQLFADLHGATLHQVGPIQVLERFLRALGVPGSEIPDGLDERAEVYRSLIGDRKVLVVLDDAVAESQVAPLLPGSGAAAGIITSRLRLTGLAGAVHIEVDVFDPEVSLNLLSSIAGARRMQSQPDQAMTVAEHCGHLPLALRIAGARLSARPHWSIQQLADRLADETHRLDELRYGELSVRPTISLSYESAGEEAKRLFRRLALLDLPVFSSWLSATVLDQPLTDAEDLLDDLVSAQLIEIAGTGTGAHSQYRFHDLIRVFARERLAAEEPATERSAALERAFGALLYLAEQAHSRHWGGEYARLSSDALRSPLPERLVDELISNPVSWFDSERSALVSAVRQAAQAGFTELCWSLAYTAVTLFETRTYFDDWRETHEIALEATRKAHNVRGQAAMLYSMGSLHIAQQRFDLARENFIVAARLFGEVGDEAGIALVASHNAYIDRLSGRLDEAEAGYAQALAIFRNTSDPTSAAYVMHGLAQVKLEQHQLADARQLLSDALRLSRTLRPGRAEAQVLHRVGESYLLSGELQQAVDTFELVLDKVRSLDDPIGESYALHGIGIAKIRQGEFGQARDALRRALDLSQTSYDGLAQGRALLGLSELSLARGDPGRAIVLGRQAEEVFRRMNAPLYGARAFTLIGEAHNARGDGDAASAALAEAAALRDTAK
jgi:DNA-binding SARP family transcriptional activator/tetratricopeptide (TPR) repeat protein